MANVIVEDLPKDQQKPSEPQELVSAPDSVEHLILSQRFELESPSKTEDGKLREIWHFAKGKSPTKDIPDVMWQVMHLESIIGPPQLGESRLDKLYRYCKLRRQEAQIQSELKTIGGSQYLGR